MAVTVTVWEEDITAGAVYRPLLIVPIAGFRPHVTAVLPIPDTVAVKCCVWDA